MKDIFDTILYSWFSKNNTKIFFWNICLYIDGFIVKFEKNVEHIIIKKFSSYIFIEINYIWGLFTEIIIQNILYTA